VQGLGKTIQVISFLAGLHHSGMFRPSLIVCPATVLRQWLRELRAWWPLFRVALLHDSARGGSGGMARPSRQRIIRDIGQVSDSRLRAWIGVILRPDNSIDAFGLAKTLCAASRPAPAPSNP
jgi:SNF2 family DNA or RNA helicase